MRSALLVWMCGEMAFGQSTPAPLNLDFAEGEAVKTPPGWISPAASMDYKVELRRAACFGATGCAVVIGPPEPPAGAGGNIMQSFDATPYRGRTIRMCAMVKLDAAAGQGRAQMWLRVDRPNGTIGYFHNMDNRPVTTAQWTAFEISGNVLVQPEMERGRSPLVSIPPFGRGFSRHEGLPIRCGLLEERRSEAAALRSSLR